VQAFEETSFLGLTKAGISYSDAIIIGNENVSADLLALASASGKPILGFQGEDTYIDAYSEFYSEVLAETSVLAD